MSTNKQSPNNDQDTKADDRGLALSQVPNSAFRRSLLGGYKVADVDRYIERAEEVLEKLVAENRQLKVEMDTLQQRDMEMHNAVDIAERFSRKIVAAAKRETAALLDMHHGSLPSVPLTESRDPDSLDAQIEALKGHRERLTSELNSALEAHTRLLETIQFNAPADGDPEEEEEDAVPTVLQFHDEPIGLAAEEPADGEHIDFPEEKEMPA